MKEEVENSIFILDENELLSKIHNLMHNEDMSAIEAFVALSEELDIEIELIAKVVGHGILKGKIQAEAEEKNLIARTSNSIKIL